MKKKAINQKLRMAGWAAIGLLLLLIPSLILDAYKKSYSDAFGFVMLYIFSGVVSVLLTILYVFGFEMISKKAKVPLLAHAAYSILVFSVISASFSIIGLFIPTIENTFTSIILLFFAGIISIVFGISLLRLKKQFKSIATSVGIINIIIGVSFITVILFPIGLILVIPAGILEAMILFRAAKMF